MLDRRLISAGIVAVLIVGATLWVRSRPADSNTPSPVEFEAAEAGSTSRLVAIGDQAYIVEVATTRDEQARGLSNRDSLADTAGMLFPFNPPGVVSFWMKEMRFPIDIVWIANGKVIGVVKNAPIPPTGSVTQNLPTYAPPAAVDYVLELNAGQSQFFAVGDAVIISSLEST